MKTTLDGVLTLYINLAVSVEQMKKWKPERIAALFDGMAKIEQACGGAVCFDDSTAIMDVKALASTVSPAEGEGGT